MAVQFAPILLGAALVIGVGLFLFEAFSGNRPQAHSYQTYRDPPPPPDYSNYSDPSSRASSVNGKEDNNENNLQKRNRKNQDKCAICLNVLKAIHNLKKLACGHTFHFKCIGEWLNVKSTCPLCRQ